MDTEEQKKFLIGWLNDAHAMEQGIIETLERQAKQLESDVPDAAERIREHLETTKRQVERMKTMITELGGDVSGMKTAAANVGGALQGMLSAIADDKSVKIPVSMYAVESYEIATYTAIIAAAQALGEEGVVEVSDDILSEEEDMASWIIGQIPTLTNSYLGATA